jgi:putative heme-binding domain-containing protein
MQPGLEPSEYSPEGFVLRFRPDGGDLELVASGLRNSFDLAFNRAGDLFTFDSDMEWDLGAPWYRPTRICHLVSGGEFGWRGDAAIWPDYLEDGVAPVVDVGPASPTGVAFGYGARFPARYRRALFACDWTFATIHAVHLEPSGATYRATVEEFVGGSGLPVTDLAIGADGAMYFIIGGRRLGSALYRVRHAGEDPAGAADLPLAGTEAALHGLRRRLEEFHGRKDERAIAAAWPHLGHDDRAIRFAARVAIESQPVAAWRQRALEETGIPARILGLLSLARRDTPASQTQVIAALGTVDAGRLPAERLLGWLRAHELALARGGGALEPERESIRRRLTAFFPHDDPRVNRELSRLLCFLREPSMVPRLLARMAADEGERPLLGTGNFVRNPKYGQAIRDILQSAPLVDRMHHARMLLWIEDGWTPAQRSEYFRLLADAAANTRGGHWYGEFWKRIREAALERIPEDNRREYAAIGADPTPASQGSDLPRPRGPGKDWELGEILAAVEARLRDRDFSDGKQMFQAAQCSVCHRFNGEGSSVGPDLSAIGQRFTARDLLDATLNPSKAVSDQYRVSLLLTADGRTLSGRVVSRDDRQIALAMDLKRPGQVTHIDAGSVTALHSTGISTMPEELLDPLNLDEILNLVAYLISGGDARHPVFRR